MNFTLEVKKEIINRSLAKKRTLEEAIAAKKAALSAFIRTSGQLGFYEGLPNFFITTETERVAEFFTSLFYDVFGFELSVSAHHNKLSGRDKLLLTCPATECKRVLKDLGLLRDKGDGFKAWIPSALVRSDESKAAYIRGAFLGSGSCILPSEENGTGYHLEIVFGEEGIADEFCGLLEDFELFGKRAERKDTFIVYIKSKEMISDFLSVIGAEKALESFTELLEIRDEANQHNRATNCYMGNLEKTLQASSKQVRALKILKGKEEFLELSPELQALANARLRSPMMTLQELANELKISKSCLSHRMRKLMSVAEKYVEEK
ncbi:MAG: DNA-binding protein WhiA [Clostridia bacterium]|nr:DNA-binding protein WhiA [Clostridia bacterium]